MADRHPGRLLRVAAFCLAIVITAILAAPQVSAARLDGTAAPAPTAGSVEPSPTASPSPTPGFNFDDIFGDTGDLAGGDNNNSKPPEASPAPGASVSPSPSPAPAVPAVDENYVDNTPDRFAAYKEPHYAGVLAQWQAAGLQEYTGDPASATPGGDGRAIPDAPDGYSGAALPLNGDARELSFTVNAPRDALYQLNIDYYALPEGLNPVELGLKINGAYQYSEMRKVVLPKYWLFNGEHGTALSPEPVRAWRAYTLVDSSWQTGGPMLIKLKAGPNDIRLEWLRESALIGRVTLSGVAALPAYAEYSRRAGPLYAGESLTLEAEAAWGKTSNSIMAASDGDAGVVPNEPGKRLTNTLGGKSWKSGGDSAVWRIDAPQDGYYHITIKYLNNFKTGLPSFRTVLVNGTVPFEELKAYPFSYSQGYENRTLSAPDGTPYRIWLNRGINTLELAADPSPYGNAIRRIETLTRKINNLYIELRMITGNNMDPNRDWNLAEVAPDALNRLGYYAREFESIYNEIRDVCGRSPDQARDLMLCAEQIRNLMREPDKIMVRYGVLSENSGSILQMAGEVLAKLPEQYLKLDRIYIHGGGSVPPARAGFLESLAFSVAGLFKSFFTDYTKQDGQQKGESLQIWVTRSRQYVNLLDAMTAADFTARTGIKVEFSLLPDEGKLALAIASGEAPDAAMGVSSHIPFNLALRNAVYDLKNFDNYNDVAGRFTPGALMPYLYDKGCYALPETQFFFVLAYRKDILQGLGLKPPQTWDDLKAMLPVLQRNGMNAYLPLSSGQGFKYFALTLPFIYQSNGPLYKPDGTAVAIDDDQTVQGMKLMSELYTVYSVPLQVQSFYNKFRSGELPVGILDFTTYNQLLSAAPEIAGLWDIALSPGIRQPDGSISRWQTGTAESLMIFSSSEKKQQAWQFFDWWMSTAVQQQYGNAMYALYGKEYGWNTANLQAFAGMPWPEEHKRVILEQWKWLKDVTHMPGDYMLEREISNAWNKIVFNGVNERRAIGDAVINSNRELRRKLEEFGYMKDGVLTRPIDVPDLGDVLK